MLHALPALLDDLERRLVQGEDPMPLVGSIRWSELIDWPRNHREALLLKARVGAIQNLLQALQAPLQAALSVSGTNPSYQADGRVELPRSFSIGIQENV